MSAPGIDQTELDAVVAKTVTDERRPTWWHTPAILSFFGILSLLAFGLGGRSGRTTSFHLATGADFFAIGDVAVPSRAGSILLAVLCLVLAAWAWARAWQGKKLGMTWLVVFGVLWVLSFLVWIVAGQTLPLTSTLQTTMALAVPLAFGALSGVLGERAGVVNIAIEGQLLFGAFGAALFSSITGNVWVGVIAAPIVALGIGALLALFAVGYAVQQIIVGVVLNVLAVGITTFLAGTIMKDDPALFNTARTLPDIPIPGLASIPVIGPVAFNQNILVYLMYVIVAVATFALFKTRWGLRVRAVGEHPKAADTVGINVSATRWRNVLLGSAVAGLGGATFTLGTGVAFAHDMSAGKGYIALAAMILGRYTPVGALCAALFFGFADALQLQLGILQTQAIGAGLDKVSIPTDLMHMLPYLVTLLAISGFVGRVRVPAADGDPYIKE